LLCRAWTPTAVFWPPVVLLRRASAPTAVFSLPVVLLSRASAPTAVLKLPVVLLLRACFPTAVLSLPLLGWAVTGGAKARVRAHRIVSDTRIDVMRVSFLSLGDPFSPAS